MGRPPKVKPPQGDESANGQMAEELASLRADIRAIAAYITDRDQLRPNAHGSRIAEIALGQ